MQTRSCEFCCYASMESWRGKIHRQLAFWLNKINANCNYKCKSDKAYWEVVWIATINRIVVVYINIYEPNLLGGGEGGVGVFSFPSPYWRTKPEKLPDYVLSLRLIFIAISKISKACIVS